MIPRLDIEFKSRSAAEIREYVLAHASSEKRSLGDTSRSKKVLGIFDSILEKNKQKKRCTLKKEILIFE